MVVSNKVAVITGAASGIGAATSKRYGERGASVVAVDVDADGGRDTVAAITDAGGEARFVEADVTDPAEVQAAIETAVEAYGGLDVLFNNAGILGDRAEIQNFTTEAFRDVIDVNLLGVFHGIKYGVPAMLADGGGSIVNTASVSGVNGHPGRCAYSATKAGISGLTRTAAMEYAQDDIRVNAILPGIVPTQMHHRAADQSAESDRLSVSMTEPMPDTEDPTDIADAVLFLGSDLSARITGVELPVDGGLLASP